MAEPQDRRPSGAPWEPTSPRRPSGEAAQAGGPGASRSAPDDWSAALGGTEAECVDWCPICRTADVLRATTSPELREQLSQIQREALITVRAVLDHYLERLDEQPRDATPVEEIPIE